MAFYWQSGGEAASGSGPSPWDYINLGGAPDASRYSQLYQETAAQPPVQHQQQQWAEVTPAENGYAQGSAFNQTPHHQTGYSQQHVYNTNPTPEQYNYYNQQTQFQQHQQQPPSSLIQAQDDVSSTSTSAQQHTIEHAPILPKKKEPSPVLNDPVPLVQQHVSHDVIVSFPSDSAFNTVDNDFTNLQTNADDLYCSNAQEYSGETLDSVYEQDGPSHQEVQQSQIGVESELSNIVETPPLPPPRHEDVHADFYKAHVGEDDRQLLGRVQTEDDAMERFGVASAKAPHEVDNDWAAWAEETNVELTEKSPEPISIQSEPIVPSHASFSRDGSEIPSEAAHEHSRTPLSPAARGTGVENRRSSHSSSLMSEKTNFTTDAAATAMLQRFSPNAHIGNHLTQTDARCPLEAADHHVSQPIIPPLPSSETFVPAHSSVVHNPLDITVPSPSTDKPALSTQLSDTQNSDRTSDGFVKVAPFNEQVDKETTSAANPLFDQWNAQGQPMAPVSRFPASSSSRFSRADYHEQEANDSAASSVPTSREQIVAQYMEFKKRIPAIVGRRNGVPLSNRGHANPLFEEGRRSVLSRVTHNSSISRPVSAHPDQGIYSDRLNSSLLTNPDGPLDMSFDSPQSAGYGEGFVENSRKSRLFRSSVGGRGSAAPDTAYEQRYASSRPQQHRSDHSGRRSVAGYGDAHISEPQHRRPQSSYDTRAVARMERSGLPPDQYDAFNSPGVSSDSADGGDCSDVEMAQYNSHSHIFSQTEIYLIGSLRVPLAKFVNTVRKFPPPPAFYQLRPVEKVAFVFYTALWQRNYSDLAGFHKKFNRDFFTLTAAGIDDEEALYRICAQLQEKHMQLRKEQYTNTQKQLFSDERDSHDEEDRQSERGSVYEKPDETDDQASVEAYTRAPLKFRTPHAFVTFGAGGRMLILNPNVSVAAVEVTDVRSVLKDEHSSRMLDVIQMFRGPLTSTTPPHQVTLYIRRQIDRIMHSEVAQENPHDNDVTDCLLIWQLLQIVVQQHGKVTGPDIARLLMEAAPAEVVRREQLLATHREQSTTPTPKTQPTVPSADPRVHDRFTQYLLAGHVEEAIDLALRHGLYADALVLARRVDPSRLALVEERYMAAMSQKNPVTTLLAVATNQPAPILINPPTDDGGSWRAHSAVVLANLNTESAMSTVYQLGKVLAQREYHAAADFCFLAVALLTSFDPFQPVPQAASAEAPARQHISLIHASMPDDEHDSTLSRFGFSLTDLHATEIFAYGVSLAKGSSPLTTSIEYQVYRVQYAKLLADFGFQRASYQYCTDIARQIWAYYGSVPLNWLLELCETADRMRISSEEPAENCVWVQQLRSMIATLPSTFYGQSQTHVQQSLEPAQPAQPVNQAEVTHAAHQTEGVHQPVANSLDHRPPQAEHHPEHISSNDSVPSTPHYQNHLPHTSIGATALEPAAHEAEQQKRPRISSISSDAAEWHNNHQSPLTIRPSVERRASISSQASVVRAPLSQPPPQPKMPSIPQHTNQAIEERADIQTPRSPSPSQMYTPPEAHSPVTVAAPPTVPQVFTQSIAAVPTVDHTQTVPSHTPQNFAAPQTERATTPKSNHLSANKSNPIKKSPSGGFFTSLTQKIVSKLPSTNAMKLPDDSNPTIRWDPVLGRYVGEGIEEETAAAPPPLAVPAATPAPATAGPTPAPPSGGLRAARSAGGSRYFNATSPSSSANVPQMVPMPPMMPTMLAGAFIPTQPENDDSGDSPFSSAPALPVDAQAQQDDGH